MVEFQLRVYSNAHYMDESEAYTVGGFQSWQAALEHAQSIGRDDFSGLFKPGMDAETLLKTYQLFGNDPVIAPSEPPGFSAWEFAKTLAPDFIQHQNADE